MYCAIKGVKQFFFILRIFTNQPSTAWTKTILMAALANSSETDLSSRPQDRDIMSLNYMKDFPAGPLDQYRSKASFSWKTMRLFLDGEDIIRYKVRKKLLFYPENNHALCVSKERYLFRKVYLQSLLKLIITKNKYLRLFSMITVVSWISWLFATHFSYQSYCLAVSICVFVPQHVCVCICLHAGHKFITDYYKWRLYLLLSNVKLQITFLRVSFLLSLDYWVSCVSASSVSL